MAITCRVVSDSADQNVSGLSVSLCCRNYAYHQFVSITDDKGIVDKWYVAGHPRSSMRGPVAVLSITDSHWCMAFEHTGSHHVFRKFPVEFHIDREAKCQIILLLSKESDTYGITYNIEPLRPPRPARGLPGDASQLDGPARSISRQDRNNKTGPPEQQPFIKRPRNNGCILHQKPTKAHPQAAVDASNPPLNVAGRLTLDDLLNGDLEEESLTAPTPTRERFVYATSQGPIAAPSVTLSEAPKAFKRKRDETKE